MMSHAYVIGFHAMGCKVNMWLETDADGTPILQHMAEQLEAFEASLSRFRPDSELSRLNAHSGQWVAVSPTLLRAALVSKQAARLTEGLCNPMILSALLAVGYTRSFEQLDGEIITHPTPSVPDWRTLDIDVERQRIRLPEGAGLDLGGVAKGWAAEQIANSLKSYGACLVNLGGDIVTRGHEQVIDIGEPGEAVANVLSVRLQDAAIATSGIDHRRWQTDSGIKHHLIDPRTGVPAETDVLTATVIHPKAHIAEAYAKAVLLMGSDAGLAWISQQWQSAAMIVRNDRAVLSTSNFVSYVLEKEYHA